MIRLILDQEASSFEQDIRELVQEFYPGEDYEIRTPDGVHLVNTTQEEKNALKAAKESGVATAVNKKSTKSKAKMAAALNPEGVSDESIRLSIDVRAAEWKLSGIRKEDKSVIKAHVYRYLQKQTGKELPWGDLTGIRPVSLVSPMLEAIAAEKGEVREEDIQDVRKKLEEEYLIHGAKLDLMTDIALREHRILDRIRQETGMGYKEGWSLYVGIPFCPTRCLYCSFLSNSIDLWEKRLDDYMENLRREIRFTVEEMCVKRHRPLQTIYIGGGTPTALDEKRLEELMDILHELCGTVNASILEENGKKHPNPVSLDKESWSTGMVGVVEFTVEAGRPDSINREKLEILKRSGVTRISVNPQTFNQKTLDLIGRKHTTEDVLEKFHMARDVGFDNINMDIILGLPGEKLPEVTETLCTIAKHKPESLTVHSLAIKRAARLTLERDYWAGIYRAGDEQEILKETSQQEAAVREGSTEEFRYPEITRMMLASEYTAEVLGMKPYYLYRQKNMAGNLENVGYCMEGKECLYNILMMEEKHTVLGCGAGCSSKFVLPSRDGDPSHKRVERCDNGKDIRSYVDDVEKFIDRKRALLSEM